MKTRELIRQLQELDPSGELECCVGNADIHFLEHNYAFYDGNLQILKRDPNISGYNIVGGIIQTEGYKIRIHTLSLQECLFEHGFDFPIEIRCSDKSQEASARSVIERWKQEIDVEMKDNQNKNSK